MKTIATEVARAKKLGAVSNNKSFKNGGVRNVEMNAFADGDVFIIPDPTSAEFEVLEQPIRGSFTEDPVTGQKKQNTAEFVFVQVDRRGNSTVAQLYPSLFWKTRQVADASGQGTGEYRTASGEVVDEVQNYADIMDFFAANKGKKVKIDMGAKFNSPRFNGNGVQQVWVPTLTWVA